MLVLKYIEVLLTHKSKNLTITITDYLDSECLNEEA